MKTIKNLFLSVALLLATGTIFGQTNTFPASGNVGIGLTSPKTKLHLGNNNSSITGAELLRISMPLGAENTVVDALHIDTKSGDYNFNRGAAISLGLKSGTYGDYTSRIVHFSDTYSTRASKMQLQTHSATQGVWNTGLLIDNIGNIGIGITNPKTNLHIGNNNSSRIGTELLRISIPLGGENTVVDALHIDPQPGDHNFKKGVAIALGYKSLNYGDYTSRIVHFSDPYSTRASKLQFQTHSVSDGTWNTGLLIDNVGNIGIGTTSPTSLLTVAGKIEAREVKVTANAGADFVFEEDYNLRDLNEVEAFVSENKHLPEIASAKEMQENGVNMGDFQIQLLQKIEELTLYVIDLKKENEVIKAENKEIMKIINNSK